VSLHCVDQRGAAEVISLPLPTADGAQNEEKLVFRRYGKTYFLTQGLGKWERWTEASHNEKGA
jgi:hypothetical protein